MKFCPACGTQCADTVLFCSACGKAFAAPP
ncbi:MAG: zinc-ribbon domain-containing protein, partial [Oscillospiraceae bacterium]|nr:zinc-ribbon domain-containing protein [Oscillospiraceae bacterium]